MKERPILFSGEMVRAILDGRKTQTRRVCKVAYHAGEWAHAAHPARDGMPVFWWDGADGRSIPGRAEFTQQAYETGAVCPYGQPGDRLWVRETWNCIDTGRATQQQDWVRYRATDGEEMYWRSSIHMPRWASRITLEVVGVRVERIQDISEADAWAEGVTPAVSVIIPHDAARRSFSGLWDSINAQRGYGWDANPWVWVVKFKQVTE